MKEEKSLAKIALRMLGKYKNDIIMYVQEDVYIAADEARKKADVLCELLHEWISLVDENPSKCQNYLTNITKRCEQLEDKIEKYLE